MDKPINILDKDYLQWVKELCKRYMPDAEGLSERDLRYTKSYISFIVKRLEFCSNLLPIQEAKLGGNIEHE